MLKIAVVGVGSMGYNHARICSKLSNVNFVGVCDTDEERGLAIAKEFGTNYFNKIEELMADTKPQAVIIATPTSHHFRVAMTCLRNGVNILVEKPLAINSKEAKQIENLANKNNLILAVGHTENYNPAVVALKKMIDLKIIGDIISIISRRVGIYPPRIKDVDVVRDLAIHDLDIITYILGKTPKYVVASGDSSLGGIHNDHAEIFLGYDNFGCFLQTNWITPVKIRSLQINGTKKYVELNYDKQELVMFNSIPLKQAEIYSHYKKNVDLPKGKVIIITKKEPLMDEIADFINAIKHKKSHIVDGSRATKAIKLVEKINQSIKEKRLIFTKNI